MPDERKMHEMPVPRLGGITFLPILLMSITLVMGLWVMQGHTYQVDNLALVVTRFLLLFVGLMMLYLVGVVDDLICSSRSQVCGSTTSRDSSSSIRSRLG